MRRASGLVRVLIVLLALAQALGPSSMSLADARLFASEAALSGTPHVEDHGSSSCPRSHTLDCGLCQYVSAAFLPFHDVAAVDGARRAIPLPPGPAELQRAAVAPRQPPSRAPPTSLPG